MKKLLHKQTLDWKGTKHEMELYESDEISDLGFTNQCQAVPFVDDDHIVIFKHIDGYYSLPGGTVEDGEKFEDTLKREVMEESGCEVLDYGLVGYFKDTEIPSGKVKYQLRYWAHVKPGGKPQDPDGKALDIEIVKFEDANKKLNWGERGQVLLDLAERKYKEHIYSQLMEIFTVAYMQFNLNKLMQSLVRGNVWEDFGKMWVTNLRGLEHAYLQGLDNVITRPNNSRFPTQISIHNLYPDFKSKYPKVIEKIHNWRNMYGSHTDSKARSALKSLGLSIEDIDNIFQEIIDIFVQISKPFHPKTDIKKFFNQEKELVQDQLKGLFDLINQKQ